jgi:hypothetical protein
MRIDYFIDDWCKETAHQESKCDDRAKKQFQALVQTKKITSGWVTFTNRMFRCLVVPSEKDSKVTVYGIDTELVFDNVEWIRPSRSDDIMMNSDPTPGFDEGFAVMFKIKDSRKIVVCHTSVVEITLDDGEELVYPRVISTGPNAVWYPALFTNKGVFVNDELAMYRSERCLFTESDVRAMLSGEGSEPDERLLFIFEDEWGRAGKKEAAKDFVSCPNVLYEPSDEDW